MAQTVTLSYSSTDLNIAQIFTRILQFCFPKSSYILSTFLYDILLSPHRIKTVSVIENRGIVLHSTHDILMFVCSFVNSGIFIPFLVISSIFLLFYIITYFSWTSAEMRLVLLFSLPLSLPLNLSFCLSFELTIYLAISLFIRVGVCIHEQVYMCVRSCFC